MTSGGYLLVHEVDILRLPLRLDETGTLVHAEPKDRYTVFPDEGAADAARQADAHPDQITIYGRAFWEEKKSRQQKREEAAAKARKLRRREKEP